MKTDIFLQIRTKTLQQYVKPYKIIDMNEIAAAFGLSLDEIERNLSELITSGKIKAKIDSHNKQLISRKENVQVESYKKAVALGDTFIRETEDQLLKIEMIRHDIVLEDRRSVMI
jgi:COP9 signalosome complex subunit 1